MLSGARLGTGGFSPVAEAGLWVDMRANPDSAASLDRAAHIQAPSHHGINIPRQVVGFLSLF